MIRQPSVSLVDDQATDWGCPSAHNRFLVFHSGVEFTTSIAFKWRGHASSRL